MLFLPGSAQEGDKTGGGDIFVRCLQRNIIFMKTLILFKCNVKKEKKKTYRNKNVTCFYITVTFTMHPLYFLTVPVSTVHILKSCK